MARRLENFRERHPTEWRRRRDFVTDAAAPKVRTASTATFCTALLTRRAPKPRHRPRACFALAVNLSRFTNFCSYDAVAAANIGPAGHHYAPARSASSSRRSSDGSIDRSLRTGATGDVPSLPGRLAESSSPTLTPACTAASTVDFGNRRTSAEISACIW